MEKQSNTLKNSWTRGKCLGKGSFGTVNLAINESDGCVFAVKSVDLATCLPNQLVSLETEIRILASLSSPFVVEYLSDDVTASYRNLHMEYLPGGTVSDSGIIGRRLADVEERILRCQTRCLVSGLKYVHGEGIVHCDVKGKNVLVGSDFTSVKLADFGSAFEIIKNENARSLITPRGSPLWMAPEVIRGEYQGPESDVWSLGCTVIEMVTGKPAWEDQGFNSLSRIANSDELPALPAQLSELGKDFVEKCFRRDWNQRWSCEQLLQHPFLASVSVANMTSESSPRCVLDFVNSDFEEDENTNVETSARERICKLATVRGVLWKSDGWITARCHARESCVNCEEGTITEYPELMITIEKETEGTSSVYHCSIGIGIGIGIGQGIERADLEIFDSSDICNSVEGQCSDYEDVRGRLKWSTDGLRCDCSAYRIRRYMSLNVELTVDKREFRSFYRICNLLQLFLSNLRVFRYILFVFCFNYYFIVTILFESKYFILLKLK